jgi:hypothetical protein
MMRRQRNFGMSFRDRQAVTVNVERDTYRELQDVLKQERKTLSEFLHSVFVSKLEGAKNSSFTNNQSIRYPDKNG